MQMHIVAVLIGLLVLAGSMLDPNGVADLKKFQGLQVLSAFSMRRQWADLTKPMGSGTIPGLAGFKTYMCVVVVVFHHFLLQEALSVGANSFAAPVFAATGGPDVVQAVVLPAWSSGPGGRWRMDFERDDCRAAWWRTLLYINNFGPRGAPTCVIQLWSMAVDLQCFAVCQLSMWIWARWMRRSPKPLQGGAEKSNRRSKGAKRSKAGSQEDGRAGIFLERSWLVTDTSCPCRHGGLLQVASGACHGSRLLRSSEKAPELFPTIHTHEHPSFVLRSRWRLRKFS
ncbi:uncharacterized protein LOC117642453 [Thrips palmi]|uniref:Uncharacterized protein LOC117642453 n=1 Tax=Thrips palmi TaxID=161013 RepID=A0A6P8YR82_THRPL|nr:uncharacterized protein LOC117642453 [Thrips palmi]